MAQSTEKTSSGVVVTGVGRIIAAILTPAAAAATLVVDDSVTGGGAVKVSLSAVANGDSRIAYFGDEGVECTTGIYATITGTGAKAYIVWK